MLRTFGFVFFFWLRWKNFSSEEENYHFCWVILSCLWIFKENPQNRLSCTRLSDSSFACKFIEVNIANFFIFKRCSAIDLLHFRCIHFMMTATNQTIFRFNSLILIALFLHTFPIYKIWTRFFFPMKREIEG